MGRKIRHETRCTSCLLRPEHCICSIAPRFDLVTRVVLVTHWRELYTTTNTGRLLRLALKNCEMRVRGRRDEPVRQDGIAPAAGSGLVLFPGPGSRPLTVESAGELAGPVTLVVPDGSWRQARRMPRREPALAGLPHFHVEAARPSRYGLRRAPHPHCLCTLEAVAAALGILEGPAIQTALEDLLAEMVRRTLLARPRRPEPQPRHEATSAG